MIYNETLNEITLNDYKIVRGSCTLYIVLLIIFLVKSIVISAVFFIFISIQKKIMLEFNPGTPQTTIY